MNVRNEIEQHSAPGDKPILFWLLERYPYQSQFRFVAKCTHKRYGRLSFEMHRIWVPTPEGRMLYAAHNDNAKRLDQPINSWKDPTGFSAEMVLDEAENWTTRHTGKQMLLNYAAFLASVKPEAG